MKNTKHTKKHGGPEGLRIRFKSLVIWGTLPSVKLIYKSHLAN